MVAAPACSCFGAPRSSWRSSSRWRPSRGCSPSPTSRRATSSPRRRNGCSRRRWTNFASVFRYFDLWSLVKSSLIISIGSTVLSLLLGVPAGYALARAQNPRAVWVAYFFLLIRTVPPIATLIPFYLLMRDIGLLGTWWAVILLNTALNTAFVVWMMFSYFRAAPVSIEEAALTDGCTDWGAFVTTALPTVTPGVIASAIFCVMFSWNDFLYAMFLTRPTPRPSRWRCFRPTAPRTFPGGRSAPSPISRPCPSS